MSRIALCCLLLAAALPSPAWAQERTPIDDLVTFDDVSVCVPTEDFRSFLWSFFTEAEKGEVILRPHAMPVEYAEISRKTVFSVFPENWYVSRTKFEDTSLFGLPLIGMEVQVQIPSAETDFTLIFQGSIKSVEQVLKRKGFKVAANRNVNLTVEGWQSAMLLSADKGSSGLVRLNCVVSPE